MYFLKFNLPFPGCFFTGRVLPQLLQYSACKETVHRFGTVYIL